MPDRTENGWKPFRVTEADLEWVDVPGCDPPVSLQFLKGIPAIILRAYAADYNAYVEKLRDADSAGATPNWNSVDTSNHWNGTACDLNWDSHPFRVNMAGFTPQMAATMREILKFYEGMVFWAQDWDDPKDAMHHQMGYGTYENQGKCRDFIARKIRADGFSTFRRGGETPAPPVTPAPEVKRTAVDVLYDAVPVIDEERAAELLGPVRAGLIAAKCNNPKRIAMYLAQCGHESAGFATTREYGSGQRYAPYIGRTWIQITWDYNYRSFGQWAHSQGLVDDPEVFVKNPVALEDPRWAGIGAAWYWTVKQPRLNEFADAGDVENASKAINAPAWIGTSKRANGIDDRWKRYNQAIALGDELLLLVQDEKPAPEEGPLMALTDAEQKELLQKTREVWDQLRGPAGKGWTQLEDRTPVDALARVLDILESGVAVPTVDEIAAVLRAAFTKLGEEKK